MVQRIERVEFNILTISSASLSALALAMPRQRRILSSSCSGIGCPLQHFERTEIFAFGLQALVIFASEWHVIMRGSVF
jgi:hypothetical protein